MTAHLLAAVVSHFNCGPTVGPLLCHTPENTHGTSIGLGLAVIAGGLAWFCGCLTGGPKKKGKR